MTGVRVLVGTRKGAFVLTADGMRDSPMICRAHSGARIAADVWFASSGWPTGDHDRSRAVRVMR